MATWKRVSVNAKARNEDVAKPYEKKHTNADYVAGERKRNNADYVAVSYNKLVERVLLLERNAMRAQNPARLEAQLTRVENKIQENYQKAKNYDAKLKELMKNTEEVNEKCGEITKKYELKLYDLEEQADEILRGVTEMRNEMKELYKKTVDSAFDSCMIYHNLKNETYKNDTSFTLEQKLKFVRDHSI